MTKKRIIFLTLILACVFALTACSGDSYGRVTINGVQDTSYAVTGQGGSSVRYGNYVYFINGTRGFEDSDGTNNLFGEVVKGGVYRAELKGTGTDKGDGKYATFVTDASATGAKDLFVTESATDYKGDKTDLVKTELIVPKTVGTSGYGKGGIFILGDAIYYATPNNLKDKQGNVQYTKTDFFRMSLDGRNTKKLYTTESESSSSPYTFMVKDGFTYLVVLDGTNLVSIKIDMKSGKVEDTLRLAEDVTSAVLPVKPVYYDGISENTIYDFIYFERAAKDTDVTQSGDVLEFVRPDGTSDGSRHIFAAAAGADYQLDCVKDGYLFYRKSDYLYKTNLYAALSDNDEAFKAANPEGVDSDEKVIGSTIADASTVYPVVAGYEFGEIVNTEASVLVLESSSSGSSSGSSSSTTYTLAYYENGVKKATVASGSAVSMGTIADNKVYFVESSTLKTYDLASGETATVASDVSTSSFVADAIALDGSSYVNFFGKSGEASGYTLFYRTDAGEGNADPFMVGAYTEDDEPSTIESIKIETNPTKTSYTVGEKIDLTGIKVTAQHYRNEEGKADDSEIEVTEKMISGFDTSKASDSVTVTVTYLKRTATFTISVAEKTNTGCGTIAASPWLFIGGGTILLLAAGVLVAGKRKARA